MHFSKECLKLYAVTDRSWLGNSTLYAQVEAALIGGATMIQLREKSLAYKDFLEEALAIKQLTTFYSVPLIINDNIEVALAAHADGIHIGQDDLTVQEARELLGPNKIIGVTAKTPHQALLAEKEGANYIGSGAVFGSSTKLNTSPLSYQDLKTICHTTTLPVVAIGGITKENIMCLKGSGISGVAVVSGLFATPNIESTARLLYKLSSEVIDL